MQSIFVDMHKHAAFTEKRSKQKLGLKSKQLYPKGEFSPNLIALFAGSVTRFGKVHRWGLNLF
jgi:hypothetical protein